jgi:hypothetical protein
VLRCIDPLLGNDRETDETTAVAARQQPSLQWTGWKAVFSAGSVLMAARVTMNTTTTSSVFCAVLASGTKFRA